MAAGNDWLITRQQLLNRVKAQVAVRLGRANFMGAYAKRYQSEFKGRWQPVPMSQFKLKVKNSRIILGGDFHAFDQAQRVHLRLLRGLPAGKKVVLCMECFETKHQTLLNQYLEKKISTEMFLKKIHWHRRWGFPWAHYEPLIELARARGHKVIGTNIYFAQRSIKTLKARDLHAAQVIAEVAQSHPDHMIYVVFGDLHLARAHLPLQLKKAGISEEPLVLFQNSERLYFRRARQSREPQVEVLKSTHNRHCILASPPWVKWQSYLMYLEQTYDSQLTQPEESPDFTDHVQSFIRFASSDLGLKMSANDIEVYGPNDPHLDLNLRRYLSRMELKMAQFLMRNDRSFFVPSQGLFYLSRTTINHAATLAGMYIHARLSGRTRMLWRLPQDFNALIWMEAVGFFVSKLINHQRKAETLADIKAQLEVIDKKDRGREVLLLVLDQKMTEVFWAHKGKMRARKFRPRRKQSYVLAARVLGHMMGDSLYSAWSSHRFSQKTVLDYLRQPLDEKDFEKFYFKVVTNLAAMSR